MRRMLDYQADKIELVLASHRVQARVQGGIVTPRFIQFRLRLAPGTRLSRIRNLAEEIALALGTSSCRISRRQGNLNLEVPRDDPAPVRLLPLCRNLSTIPPHTAVLGLDEEGTPLLLRLVSPDVAHVLIAGTTGSGKTALARSMIASLALHNRLSQLALLLIDPKGRGYAPFTGLPHLVREPVRSAAEGLEALGWLVQEMERRDERGVGQPRVVVFLDELADLMLVGGKKAERLLSRLTQRGREAGIHLVACTQKPTARVLGSVVKSNFPLRVVGSVSSADDARVAAGLSGTGAERLLGRGDFLLVVKGQVIRFQAAYVREEEIREVVKRLQEGRRRGQCGEKKSGWGAQLRLRAEPSARWLSQRLQRVK